MAEFVQRIRVSMRTGYRLAERGEIATFKLLDKRLVDDDSVDAYILRCKAAGPQLLQPASLSGAKRRPGRPRKEPQPSTAAE